MGIQRADLEDDRRTVPYTYNGETVQVTYRPSAISPKFLRDLRSEGERDELVMILAAVLTDWDVLDGDEKVEPSADNLETFGVRFLRGLSNSLSEDMDPEEQRPSDVG